MARGISVQPFAVGGKLLQRALICSSTRRRLQPRPFRWSIFRRATFHLRLTRLSAGADRRAVRMDAPLLCAAARDQARASYEELGLHRGLRAYRRAEARQP